MKRYIDYKNDKVSKIYDFEYYSIDDIKLNFKSTQIFRIGKFLDLVYRRSLSYIKDGVYNEVYVSDKELKGILGIYYFKDVIKFLNDNKLVRCVRKGRNKYDYNKKLYHFKMNDEFFKCKKSVVDIEYGILNRWIEKNSNKKYEKIIKSDKIGGKGVDEFLVYEMNCCKDSDVKISDLDKVIDDRIEKKILERQNEVNWEFGSKRKKKEILKGFDNREDWIRKYRLELINKFQHLKESLYDLKSGNFDNVDFFRDTFGRRLNNVYSRVIREYRKCVVIDNEDCVEVDIKGSMINCFYFFVSELNNDSCKNEMVNDIRFQLKNIGNENLGSGFLEKHKLLFVGDSIFWSDDISIDDYDDFYGFMKSCFNDESDRNEYKKLIWYILFSNTIRYQKDFNYKGYNIDDLEKLFFGNDGYELINDLKKIDLFKYLKTHIGREKKYNRGTNISYILHTMENNMMDRCRKVLMDKKIKYISIFDSFIVKKSDSVNVLGLLNTELKNISPYVKFVSDVKSNKNFT